MFVSLCMQKFQGTDCVTNCVCRNFREQIVFAIVYAGTSVCRNKETDNALIAGSSKMGSWEVFFFCISSGSSATTNPKRLRSCMWLCKATCRVAGVCMCVCKDLVWLCRVAGVDGDNDRDGDGNAGAGAGAAKAWPRVVHIASAPGTRPCCSIMDTKL
eukprot:SAG11_NODE_312_length_10890_cov_44.733043_5_plen_158_part_00